MTQKQPTLTLADAYAIQDANTRRRVAAGERLVGRKVGLTSRPMQLQLGVDEPDFGVIFDRMVIPAGGAVHLAELIAPRAEAEIAVVLGEGAHVLAFDRDLPTSPTSPTSPAWLRCWCASPRRCSASRHGQ